MSKLSEALCERRPVVVLLGPTAAGKSRIAVQVAKCFDTDVLTADSRQVYRGMDIGTDKPTAEDRQGVPHRLIDLADPDQAFNTGWYRQAALAEIDRLYAARQLPFVVGGTGLYIRTLVRGLCPAPQADPHVRAELMNISKEQGRDHLYAELVHVDPDTAARLHPNDEAKVMRALEVHRLSGQPMSALHRQHGFQEAAFAVLLIGLQRPKKVLYRRIEERIDWQLAHGMVEETRALLDRVGLGDRLDHRPYELSGGEQQRVAVARALINGPELVLADEPTGNLDSRTGGEILELLTLLREERRITLIIATHDERVAAGAQRVLELVDGKIGLGD